MCFLIIFDYYPLLSISINDKQIAIIVRIAVGSSMDPIKVVFHCARMASFVLALLPFLTFVEVGFHFTSLASSSRLPSSLFAAAPF